MQTDWQKNNIMDSSNVYTTFQADKYTTLCGATPVEFSLDYDDGSGQPSQEGVRKLYAAAANTSNINLRYIYHQQTTFNNGSSVGFRWTGFSDEEYQNLVKMISGTGSISYLDYNIKSSYYGSPLNDYTISLTEIQGQGSSNASQQFITNINRENLFYGVKPTFGYINSNNQLARITPSFQEYKDWLLNDTTGFIELNGQKCFLIELQKFLLVNDGTSFVNNGRIQKKDLTTNQTINISDSGGATLGDSINLLCETQVNDALYYYTQPMSSMNDIGIQAVYGRATFGRANYSMPANTGSLSTYTYRDVDAFTYSIEQFPEFNKGFMTLPVEDVALDFKTDTFFTTGAPQGSGYYKFYGRNVMRNSTIDGGASRRLVTFYKYCISGKELMANLALNLIPFAFIESQTVVSSTTNPESMFVGVRNANGTVSGDYIPYVWGKTKVEGDFRPEDFKPQDPTKKPEETDNPDSGDLGGNPDADNYGDSIGINTDGVAPFEGIDSTKAYLVNKATLNEMFANLWNSPESFWDALSMNGSNSANVFDYLINIKAYPFPIAGFAPVKTIYLGAGAELNISATDGFFTPNSIIQDMYFGSIAIDSVFLRTFLGRQPYTRMFVHLPYSGTWEIDPKLALNDSLNNDDAFIRVHGYLDIRTGTMVYEVLRESQSIITPILVKTANIGMDIPISGADLTTQSSNIINATLSTVRNTASSAKNIFSAAAKAGVGDIGGAALDAVETTSNIIGSVANLSAASREIPQISGGTTGASAPIADSYCYIILQQPIVANPKNFNHTYGRMCNSQLNIGTQCDGKGFTQCANVDCSNIAGASEQEKAEIKRLMESGIYC